MTKLILRLKGGPGSGHFGHKGIPGHKGGSLPAGSSASAIGESDQMDNDLYNELNQKIEKLNYKYAVILNDKPYLYYKKSLKNVIYLETIKKHGNYHEKITYKLTSDNSTVVVGGVMLWNIELVNQWIKEHREGLKTNE